MNVQWPRAVVAFLCLAALAACGDREAPAPRSSAAATTPLQAPLTRSTGPEIDSLDPALATLLEAADIIRDAYEGLTVLDEDARAVPGIAESWTVSADGLTYTFHLRDGLVWSDGTPLTSSDLAASWRRVVDPKTGSPWAQGLEYVVGATDITAGKASPDSLGVNARDPKTFVVRLRARAPFFPTLAAHWSLVPTPGGAAPAKPGTAVSNGAYTVSEQVASSYVGLKKNTRYWRSQEVTIEAVRYLQIGDIGSEYNRFRAHELDVTSNAPMLPMEELRAAVGDSVRLSPFLALYYYGFNTTKPPFASRDLRRALSMAVDRDKLINVALKAANPPAYTLVPDATPDYTPQRPEWASWDYPKRLEEAKKLYKSLGYGPSKPLRFDLRYNVGTGHERIAIAVAAMWKETLGAEARLVPEEFKSLLQTIQRGGAQVFRSSWTADYADAYTFLQNYGPASTLNLSGYRSASFDRLIELSINAPDLTSRRDALQGAERVFADDAPIIPLYFMQTKRLVSNRVIGWRDNPMRVTYTRSLSLKATE